MSPTYNHVTKQCYSEQLNVSHLVVRVQLEDEQVVDLVLFEYLHINAYSKQDEDHHKEKSEGRQVRIKDYCPVFCPLVGNDQDVNADQNQHRCCSQEK